MASYLPIMESMRQGGKSLFSVGRTAIFIVAFVGLWGCSPIGEPVGSGEVEWKAIDPSKEAKKLENEQAANLTPVDDHLTWKESPYLNGYSQPQLVPYWSANSLELVLDHKDYKGIKLRGQLVRDSETGLMEAELNLYQYPMGYKDYPKAKVFCLTGQMPCTHFSVDLYIKYFGESQPVKVQYEVGKNQNGVYEVLTDGDSYVANKKPLAARAKDWQRDGDRDLKGGAQFGSFNSPPLQDGFFDDFPKGDEPKSSVTPKVAGFKNSERVKRSIEQIKSEIEKKKKAGSEAPSQGDVSVDAGEADTSEAEDVEVEPSKKVPGKDVEELERELSQLNEIYNRVVEDEASEQVFLTRSSQLVGAADFIDFEGGGIGLGWASNGSLLKGEPLFPALSSDYVAEYAEFDRHYGSGMLVSLIKGMMPRFEEIYGKKSAPLSVTALSQPEGGTLWFMNNSKKKYKSHQNGLDVDIAYLVGEGLDKVPAALDVERNFEFFKYLVGLKMESKSGKDQTSIVSRIFVSKEIKKQLCEFSKRRGTFDEEREVHRRVMGLSPVKGVDQHASHFHLRLKCPPNNFRYRCFTDADPVGHGCP